MKWSQNVKKEKKRKKGKKGRESWLKEKIGEKQRKMLVGEIRKLLRSTVNVSVAKTHLTFEGIIKTGRTRRQSPYIIFYKFL